MRFSAENYLSTEAVDTGIVRMRHVRVNTCTMLSLSSVLIRN